MCTHCGCGNPEVTLDDGAVLHTHADGTVHAHALGRDHEHEHAHGHGHLHDHGHELGRGRGHDHDHGHEAGAAATRTLQLERDILAKNDRFAAENRAAFARRGVFALNFVSSPGSGKTTLLVRTIEALRQRAAVAVIEGDQQTSLDAERIRAAGARAVQVNTGSGCHLDALMVGEAARRLAPEEASLLCIENVGNLVCPAGFDLGEAHKVLVLSVTEGEDKPLKYPDMFRRARLLLVNKIDLAPHVDFDAERCVANAHRVNPALEIMQVSARTGEGMDAWLAWLEAGLARVRRVRATGEEALA